MQSGKKPEEPDYYAALGLDKSADEAGIKKAYRSLVLTAHPDKAQDPKEKEIRTAKFMIIKDAYEVLSDPEKRKKYDAVKKELPQHLQEIITAIMNDPKKLSALLDNAKKADPQFDINAIIDDRGALMHIAAAQGKPAALQVLIDKDADVNVQDENGNTPLHLAAGRPGKDWANATVILLDSENINVNIQNNSGNTPLHVCTDRGLITNVNEILANTPDLRVKNKDGFTAMDLAASGTAPAHKEIADLLHEELNPKNTIVTALDSALDSFKSIFSSKKEPAKQEQAAPPAKEKGHEFGASTSEMRKKMDAATDNTSKLHDAIKAGDTKRVKELLSQGAEFDKKIGGEAAIHVAAKAGNYKPEVINLLIAKGANINQPDPEGNTLLHLAVQYNDTALVAALLNLPKTNVNAQNNDGETAFHKAALGDNENITALLQDHPKIDINVKDKDGITAIEILEFKLESQAPGISPHTIPQPHAVESGNIRGEQKQQPKHAEEATSSDKPAMRSHK